MSGHTEFSVDGVARQPHGRASSRPVLPATDRKRFDQLLVLAEDGDECAASDLFKEFDYVIPGGEEGSAHDSD